MIPQHGIRKKLVPGDNLIQFTPVKEGTLAYTPPREGLRPDAAPHPGLQETARLVT
jgi:hypothetical protein